MLLVGVIVGLVGWINQSHIKGEWHWYTTDGRSCGKHFALLADGVSGAGAQAT